MAEDLAQAPATLLGSRRLARIAAPIAALLFLATAGFTWWLVTQPQEADTLLSAPVVALLLVVNLLPAIFLLVLLGQRIARQRAYRSLVGGNGRLHVRLVALFSVIASLPLLLVVIFASLLFQYGVQFWFSADARGMLQNASDLARGYYQSNLKELSDETTTMAGDLRNYLAQSDIASPSFAEGYIYQVVTRKLNRSAIIEVGKDGVARTAATVDPEDRTAADVLTPSIMKELRDGRPIIVQAKPNQIEAFVLLYPDSNTFLYATRDSAVSAFSEMERAQAVLADYDEFAAQSRQLQLRFNIALFIGTLMLVGTAVWIAIAVADRLVRPVGELVDAARRVTAGDLSARVTDSNSGDELGTLAGAFNRMTQRLEAQTGALVSANSQLANRRALIEAVLSGVSAGVISVDSEGTIQIVNSSATTLLVNPGMQAVGQPLEDVSEELAELMKAGTGSDIIQLRARGEVRTLAVRVVAEDGNRVLTFDDITEQLLDQRRAAWSDVARRIAHEIKNPLTPIQLAAERLQRRYGKEIETDPATFKRLTDTIVRQVGDLRRIVDEFTSFARMPKPVFREEAVIDIARHALFLHEVAHPEIEFIFISEEADPELVCDRRQVGQALTNIVKNAVEAIEQRHIAEKADSDTEATARPAPHGHITMAITKEEGTMILTVTDDGTGLPDQRERIIEPYMTTRAKGTGLGLAIVKKIVEEHFGSISFADAESGGAVVTLRFDVERLARLQEVSNERNEDSMRETLNGA